MLDAKVVKAMFYGMDNFAAIASEDERKWESKGNARKKCHKGTGNCESALEWLKAHEKKKGEEII